MPWAHLVEEEQQRQQRQQWQQPLSVMTLPVVVMVAPSWHLQRVAAGEMTMTTLRSLVLP